MNRKRRELLRTAQGSLISAANIVNRALDEEEDCLGNTPDSLVDSNQYEKMEEVIGALSEASDSIEDAIEKINIAVM